MIDIANTIMLIGMVLFFCGGFLIVLANLILYFSE